MCDGMIFFSFNEDIVKLKLQKINIIWNLPLIPQTSKNNSITYTVYCMPLISK